VCAGTGEDAATVDRKQVRDNLRADAAGLVYDSDPRKVLVGRESNPQVAEEHAPEAQEEEEPEKKPDAAQSGIMRAK
jgi:capsid protein